MSYLAEANNLIPDYLAWFSNEVDPMVEMNPPWMQPDNVECKSEYRKNNYGLRCDDFFVIQDESRHILFAGCEKTIPENIHEQNGWAKIVYNNEIKKDGYFRNLSYPGASIHKISANLFKYFEKFGNPEKLYLLAPEMIREVGLWQEMGVFKPKIYYQYDGREEHYPMCVPNNMPMQLLGLKYLYIMRALEQYCDVAGIDLYWTTWSGETKEFLKQYNFKYFFANNINMDNHNEIANSFINEMDLRGKNGK